MTDERNTMTNLISPRLGAALRVKNAGVAYALVLLVITLTVIASQTGRGPYLSATNTANIIDQSALIGLLAITTTIVLISGNFDLSIASNAALSAVVFVKVTNAHGPAAGVVAALLVGLVIGLLNGVLVELVGINAFIVTLATLTAARGAILPVTNSETVQAEGNPLSSWTNGQWTTPDLFLVFAVLTIIAAGALFSPLLGRRVSLAALVAGVGAMSLLAAVVGGFTITLTRPSWYMIGLAAIVGFVFAWTIVGRRLFAVGGNAVAARLVGISVTRYKIVPFVVSGVVAAFVGVLFASRLGAVNPEAMSGWELTAIAAAILGGTSLFGGAGSAFKSVIGALILAVLSNGFNILNVGSEWQQLVQGAVILTAAGTYTVAARKSATRSHGTPTMESPRVEPPLGGQDGRPLAAVAEGSAR
jgi:D-xylose transport system permease protein